MFAKVWSQARGRPLKVVTVYPGPAPIGMGRVDAEWVAYNHEDANELLDEARRLLNAFDAEFVAVPSDSASHGLHDVQEAAGHDAIVILGSRKTRGVRRTAPGNTAERCCTGLPARSASCLGTMRPLPSGQSSGWRSPMSTPRTAVRPCLLRRAWPLNCKQNCNWSLWCRTPESCHR